MYLLYILVVDLDMLALNRGLERVVIACIYRSPAKFGTRAVVYLDRTIDRLGIPPTLIILCLPSPYEIKIIFNIIFAYLEESILFLSHSITI